MRLSPQVLRALMNRSLTSPKEHGESTFHVAGERVPITAAPSPLKAQVVEGRQCLRSARLPEYSPCTHEPFRGTPYTRNGRGAVPGHSGSVGARRSRKKSGSHIDASHSRQPLVKGERLVRLEVNAVIPALRAGDGLLATHRSMPDHFGPPAGHLP